MATQAKQILTPVGRLVSSALYIPRDKDFDGQPLTYNDGTARVEYSAGIAIPKVAGQHWATSPWGAIIWAAGHEGWPQGQGNAPTFSWKVYDGDSQIPNKNNKRNCDKEGWPGHWVVFFSTGTQPKLCNADGSQLLMEPNAIKPGYYIQIAGSVKDNNPAKSPGVYLNLNAVALAGYGPEIVQGIDVASVGFGGQALPAGASATPVAAMMPHAPAMPPAPAAAAPVQQYAPQPMAAPAPLPVVPNPGFVQAVGAAMPGVPAAPGMPVAPAAPVAPVAPVRQMTASAQGASYEQMISNGWTDATLIQHGHMLP